MIELRAQITCRFQWCVS